MTLAIVAVALGSVVSAFLLVFVAELGDKTQLVALGFGARESLGLVVAGVVLAYVATTSLSVVAGSVLGSLADSRVVEVVAGLGFIVFAALAMRPPASAPDEDAATGSSRSQRPSLVVARVAGAMFIAEFGDKTMLATAALAADRGAGEVWVGALAGITAAGVVGAVAGRVLGDRLPERPVRWISAGLFAAFGIGMLIG